jgi:hypothetical protein
MIRTLKVVMATGLACICLGLIFLALLFVVGLLQYQNDPVGVYMVDLVTKLTGLGIMELVKMAISVAVLGVLITGTSAYFVEIQRQKTPR